MVSGPQTQPERTGMPPVGHPGWDQPRRPRARGRRDPGGPTWVRRDGRIRRNLTWGQILARIVRLSVARSIVAIAAMAIVTLGMFAYDTLTGRPFSFPDTSSPDTTPSVRPGTTTAPLGSPVTLAGTGDGEQAAVTAVRVISADTHTSADSPFSGPVPGERLYVVQFRVDNTGSVAYSTTGWLDSKVIDSAGKSYEGSLTDSVSDCPGFSDSDSLAPGSSELGCVVFDVPATATITDIRYTPDDSLSPQTGQWTVAK